MRPRPRALRAPARKVTPTSAWFEAAHRGDAERLAELAFAGARLEAKDTLGGRALAYCAAQGHVEATRVLLALGADPDARGPKGFSGHGEPAAMLAARNDRPACLALLIGAGADLEAEDALGSRALPEAAANRGADCLAMLLGAGADPDGADQRGNAALACAASQGKAAHLRALLAAGASVDEPNQAGSTPAMQAADNGELECLGILLDAGASLEARDNAIDGDGDTVARRAAKESQLACLELALARGAGLDQGLSREWIEFWVHDEACKASALRHVGLREALREADQIAKAAAGVEPPVAAPRRRPGI